MISFLPNGMISLTACTHFCQRDMYSSSLSKLYNARIYVLDTHQFFMLFIHFANRTRLQTPVPSIKCILLEVYHPPVTFAFQSSAQSGLLHSTRLRTADLLSHSDAAGIHGKLMKNRYVDVLLNAICYR